MAKEMNSPPLRIRVGPLPPRREPPLRVEIKVLPIAFTFRDTKFRVLVASLVGEVYPKDGDRYLLLDMYTTEIGKEPITIPPITHKTSGLFKLDPRERKRFVFRFRFGRPGLYEVCARLREVRVLQSVGTPNWSEEFFIASHADPKIGHHILQLSGVGWSLALEDTGASKYSCNRVRVLSWFELLQILGAIAAIISAVASVLTLLTK